ncbi:MAG: glycerol kinase, partial [Clostridiales bacterium]|nr:glycerol kinase [Clostridiales bacterium]
MDIRKAEWDQGLLDLCETPRSILPEIHDTSEVYANTDPDEFLGISIPIGASQVDAHSALVAQGCVHPGDIKTAYGTGCFMNMILGDTFVESKSGLGISYPWRVKDEKCYAFGSSAFTAGSALQWLRDGLKIIDSSPQSQELALSVPDSCGVVFVPAFSGLGTPYWDQRARGLFIGLTGGVTRAHIARAVLESIAFQNYDIAMAMAKDSQLPINVMKAEGGPSDNEFLMQFQADILNIPLEIPDEKETAAYGAGFMGALGIGAFDKVSDASGLIKLKKRYEPKMSQDERESRIFEWHRAVERSKEWLIK